MSPPLFRMLAPLSRLVRPLVRPLRTVSGDIISPGSIGGLEHLRDAGLNKGLAFTLEERQALGLHGLLPPRIKTQEEQVQLCKMSLMRYTESLNKYMYLCELMDRNEKLFFHLLTENVETLMPIVYTPTVGLACQRFGLIYRNPRGLFVSINDRGHCFDVMKNWPEHDVRVICVTDGERILGLGDLGACGMGIPVGKLALNTALAGVKPHYCLPIVLDAGTNNKKFLDDPLYIGLSKPRVSGPEYDSFVDEFMEACVRRYSQSILIQFEDFGNHNAFRYLDKYREKYCVFNDDIQGTASVAVAGMLASVRVTGKKMSQHKFLFFGAGEAAVGIADLCVTAMQIDGIGKEEARDRIWMMDVHGLLAKGRPKGKIEGHQEHFAKEHAPEDNFEALVNEIKPSVLIGASTVGGGFTPAILRAMASFNDRPIIFALSNPTPNSECTAEEAYTHTEGKCVFVSGSPFPPVNYKGATYHTGQGNNAYVYPGVTLGVILTKMHHISDEMFLLAAQTVADIVTEDDLKMGRMYPSLSTIRQCSVEIAVKILEYSYKKGIATVYPEPEDKRAYVLKGQYDYKYDSALPEKWTWPKEDVKRRPLEETGFESHSA